MTPLEDILVSLLQGRISMEEAKAMVEDEIEELENDDELDDELEDDDDDDQDDDQD